MHVANPLARKTLLPFMKAIFSIMFKTRLSGEIPNDLPRKLIVSANHESFLDGLLLGLFLPIDPVFVVHTTIAENPFFRIALSIVDYVAVDPTNPMSMKTLTKIIDSGRPVVIFPEGRITVTGSLMKIYDGPAFLAAKTGASVLPIRLSGTAMTYFSRLSGQHPKSFFPKLTISISKLQTIETPQLPRARDRRRAAGESLRKMMQKTIFETTPITTMWKALIEARAIHGKNKPLIEDATMREFTYSEVIKAGIAISRWIGGKQAYNGEKIRIGIMLPNVMPTLATIFGLSARGMTPCMLNYTSGADSILSSIKASCCQLILSSKSFVEKGKLHPIIAAMENAGLEIAYLEDLKPALGLIDKMAVLFYDKFPHKFETAQDEEDEAVVLFTSGSEGTPKGVVLPHRAVLSNVAQIKSVMDISVEDKFLCALPIFHSFGLTAGSVLPVLTGSKVFLYPSPLHYRVIPEIAYDRNCSVLFGTNTFLANYAKFANPYDFRKIRVVVAGAEKLADSTRDAWNDKFGIRIFEGYGATECSPVISVNTPMAFKRGSVGQILPGMQSSIAAVPGVDSGGLLHVKGPNVMKGYLKIDSPGEIQMTASDMGPGWHNLGDIVEIDRDGFVFIKGRLKRFAKIAGEMVSLEVVEKLSVLASSSEFQHAATTRPDPSKGESIVLFSTDAGLSKEKLLAAARKSGYSELSVPKDIRHVSAIPLLGTGKTDYVTIGKMAAEQ